MLRIHFFILSFFTVFLVEKKIASATVVAYLAVIVDIVVAVVVSPDVIVVVIVSDVVVVNLIKVVAILKVIVVGSSHRLQQWQQQFRPFLLWLKTKRYLIWPAVVIIN